ncbi:MAG: tetratricopeptide repeat protein [Bacteroidales bacterium]|nr:tetratricopeptide repeat protein [Bacteroidales bacterium]
MKYFILLIIFIFTTSHSSLSQSIDKLNVLYNNAEYYNVIKTGKELLKDNPENLEILFITGLSYQMLNKFKESERYLKEVYTLDTSNIRYINAYAYTTDRNNYQKKAFSLYNKVLDIDSLNFTALNNLSKLLFKDNQYADALKIYKTLSKQDSLNSYYYRKTANCYLKLNDADESLKYLIKAYNTDSTDVNNIKSLAIVLYSAKKYDEAIEYCNKGINVDSLCSDFYRIKANSLFSKNHFYRAVPEYKKVIKLGDSTYNVTKRLGMALCDIKKYEDALQYNLAVYKADTTSYSNTSYLSRNYLGLGESEKCIEFADKTIKLLRFAKRITSDILDNKAIAYTQSDNYQEALNMYDEKYKIYNTRYVNDFYNIAVLNDKLGNKKEAIKFYEKVIEFKNKHKIPDRENSIYEYAEHRINIIREDLFFEGN